LNSYIELGLTVRCGCWICRNYGIHRPTLVRTGSVAIGVGQLFGKTISPTNNVFFDLPENTGKELFEGHSKNHLVSKGRAEIRFPLARFVLTHRCRALTTEEMCHLLLGQRRPQAITAEVMWDLLCHKLIMARSAPNAELRPIIYANKIPTQEVKY